MGENASQPTPSVVAALLLLARELLPGCTEWPRTVADALRLSGAGKSQAYEVLGRLRHLLPTLLGSAGRPASPPLDENTIEEVLMAVRDYLFGHPGAICGTGERRTYSDDFRRFVVGLADPGQPAEGKSTAALAFASGVPLGTLREWLRLPHDRTSRSPSPGTVAGEDAPQCADASPSALQQSPALTDAPLDVSECIRTTHLRLVATLWPSWKGPFQSFCQMLRAEHRLAYGDTFIGNFLQSAGLRQRRRHTPVEAPWSSDTFRTLFPGAQWLGDGTTLTMLWKGQRFFFNLEALLDPATNSLVGFAVSDAEDEEALRFAYDAALATTDSPPLALTLDNRPSNHSPGTLAAVADTILLRATPGRGQAKAPLEGALGLFQQAMPPLVVEGKTARETARSALNLMLTAWARGRNGKPRKRLQGRTPAEVYVNARPTAEQVQEALAWFRELQRRQERARLTKEGRRDPVRIQLLRCGLAELEIPDPHQRLSVALAGYAREAIVRGLSTFRAKLELGTLPPDADPGRYLGGIIRNLHTRLELERTSMYLLEQRIRLRDLSLAPLERAAQRLRAETPFGSLPQACVDRALDATYLIDFHFWLQLATETLTALPVGQKRELYRSLSRRIAASFKTDRERRQDMIDRLAEVTASVL